MRALSVDFSGNFARRLPAHEELRDLRLPRRERFVVGLAHRKALFCLATFDARGDNTTFPWMTTTSLPRFGGVLGPTGRSGADATDHVAGQAADVRERWRFARAKFVDD